MASYDIREIATTWLHTPYHFGGDSHAGVDCSHFVWEVLKAAGHPAAPYVQAGNLGGSGAYSLVTSLPAAGDIVHFGGHPAHMGIIVDATLGTFIGAQSKGVAEASYKTGYWAGRSPDFYRYVGP